jgi:hypothetical protein
MIARRAVLAALPAAVAVLAVPTLALAAKAAPQADADAALLNFLKTAEPHDIIQYHAGQMSNAMARMKGGEWKLTIDHDKNFVLLAGDVTAPHAFLVTEVRNDLGPIPAARQMTDEAIAQHHADQLASTMERRHGGNWIVGTVNRSGEGEEWFGLPLEWGLGSAGKPTA